MGIMGSCQITEENTNICDSQYSRNRNLSAFVGAKDQDPMYTHKQIENQRCQFSQERYLLKKSFRSTDFRIITTVTIFRHIPKTPDINDKTPTTQNPTFS